MTASFAWRSPGRLLSGDQPTEPVGHATGTADDGLNLVGAVAGAPQHRPRIIRCGFGERPPDRPGQRRDARGRYAVQAAALGDERGGGADALDGLHGRNEPFTGFSWIPSGSPITGGLPRRTRCGARFLPLTRAHATSPPTPTNALVGVVAAGLTAGSTSVHRNPISNRGLGQASANCGSCTTGLRQILRREGGEVHR
jgi:hypothetical protein